MVKRIFRECNLCDKKFAENAYLRNHIRERHENENNYCEICRKSFATPSNLKNHMKFWCQSAKIQCHLCEKWLKGKSNDLNRHMLRKHSDISKNLKCNHCDKKFSEKAYLNNHIREMHEKQLHLHQCELCEKSFAAPSKLKDHMKSLHQKAQIQCNLCGTWLKEFSGSLKRHMLRTHHNSIGKNLKCNLCSKKFAERAYLRQHIRKMHEKKHK